MGLVHGGGGFLGVVACGFFAKREPLLQYWTLLGFPDRAHNGGLFVGVCTFDLKTFGV